MAAERRGLITPLACSVHLACSVLVACSVHLACSVAPPPPADSPSKAQVREGTPDEVNIVKARAMGRKQLFAWSEWSKEAFARAKSEGRFILVHGAAEWCHWCHVMEETTYLDPEVGAILRDKFVAIRVDIDSRPDIEERYERWGWPATIILSADAQELAKFRGYLKPAEMLEQLSKLGDSQGGNKASSAIDIENSPDYPPQPVPPVTALSWIASNSALRLDTYYDAAEGGWGVRQKAPIGDNVSWELRRFLRGGDKTALERAVFSLKKHAALIDPVWGGIYQYSDGSTWENPHYEKLMTYQAANLTAYAAGYKHDKIPELLGWARDIERYMNSFLSNEHGEYLVTQDADVGAHDKTATFVDGKVFYALGDAERRKRGIPWVDDNVYAEENGLAIAAMCALYEATGDAAVLARAEKAAQRIIQSHVDADSRVVHDADKAGRKIWYLADAGAFGYALARIAELKGDDGASYRDHAIAIALRMQQSMRDDDGAFWANTPDPNAFGVFARRRKPFRANINAARLFAALWRITGDDEQRDLAQTTLAAVAKPLTLRMSGRMIGTFLLALDEADAIRWTASNRAAESESDRD